MSSPQSIHDIIEDHALERVPDGERHGWLAMSWNTVGVVTTLVQIYVGALITFIAGMKIALLAGVIVALIGGTIGWGVGHIAYKTGLASGVMARIHGFGADSSHKCNKRFRFSIFLNQLREYLPRGLKPQAFARPMVHLIDRGAHLVLAELVEGHAFGEVLA